MSSPVPNSRKVFISYSWDSPEHKDRVLALADRLCDDGIDCTLDQYEVLPPEGWPRWMERQIREADFVLMICTETYLRRVLGEENPGKGHGVRWEGHLTYQHFYNAGALNTKFIPVLLESGKFEHIPTPFQGTTYYEAHTLEGYDNLYRHLTDQPSIQKLEPGKVRTLAPRERKQFFLDETQSSSISTRLRSYVQAATSRKTFDYHEDCVNRVKRIVPLLKKEILNKEGNEFFVTNGEIISSEVREIDSNTVECTIKFRWDYERRKFEGVGDYYTPEIRKDYGIYTFRVKANLSSGVEINEVEKKAFQKDASFTIPLDINCDSAIMAFRGLYQKIVLPLAENYRID